MTERRRVRRRVRHKPRRWAAGVLAATVVLGLLALLVAVPAAGARARLLEGRAAMERGRDALVAGDTGAARAAFAEAESAFIRGRAQARNPLLRLSAALPLIGRTPDMIQRIADAGVLVAGAARIAAGALEEAGGTDGLAPSGGRVPVTRIAGLSEGFADAHERTRRASEVIAAGADSLLLGPVASARDEFESELRSARSLLRKASTLAAHLPAFLGAEGERRYFFGAQNPAELRGTGGLLGAFSILRVRDGEPVFGPFRPVGTLPRRGPDLPPPHPSFAERYDRFGGASFWPNINMTPDFPSAASAIEDLYEAQAGMRVDGTIIADPEALASLLEVTGPVDAPRVGEVDAATVVPLLANEGFTRFPDPGARKRILGEVSRAVFRRFLEGGVGDPGAAATSLAEAAAGGHLLVHARDPAVQGALERAGVAGALAAPSADFLRVVGNNAAGNKVDFYVDRAIAYRAELGAEGVVAGTATVSLANDAPREGPPPYVIGPFSEDFEPGEAVTYLSVYCGPTCGLERFERDGARGTLASEHELGLPVYSDLVRVPAGSSTRLEYAWSIRDGWTGDEGSGTYTLTVGGQPTVRDTQLRIDVRIPDGMRVRRTDPAMTVDGTRVTWEGIADGNLTFRVEFERPLGARAWEGIVRFFNSTLFRIG